MNIPQSDRLVKLNNIAKKQMELLKNNDSLKKLEYVKENISDELIEIK